MNNNLAQVTFIKVKALEIDSVIYVTLRFEVLGLSAERKNDISNYFNE